jgi:DNA-binding LytR/AlgR family response regulator
MMKCLIVDDEPLAIDVLLNHIQNIESIKVEATFTNAIDAYNYLQKHAIDLIFLDINMPKLTGLDFLKSLKVTPQVIITTAHREHALEGYELDVTDYLLKPVSFERFLKAITKVSEKSATEMKATELPGLQEGTHYIFVKSNKKMVKVFLREILYVESIRDYVKIRTEKTEVISAQTITSLQDRLPKDNFLRIHKSFIVNLDKVGSYSQSVVEVNNKELPLGRLYKNEALRILTQGYSATNQA